MKRARGFSEESAEAEPPWPRFASTQLRRFHVPVFRCQNRFPLKCFPTIAAHLLCRSRPVLNNFPKKVLAALVLVSSMAAAAPLAAASSAPSARSILASREGGLQLVHFFASSPPNLAGVYVGRAPAADAAKRVFRLVLSAGGNAALTTTFLGKATVLERGHWRQKGSNLLLTFDPIGSSLPPAPITFTYHRHALHPIHWNTSEWGRAGPPVLTHQRHPDP